MQQGVATDGKYVYVQGTSRLSKYDFDGNLLLKTPELKPHHGGITYLEGKIYAAVSECKREGTAVHAVYVYDAETLKRVGEYDIHEYFTTCAGGIAYHDGFFYVIESYFDETHQDYVVKLDRDFKYIETFRPNFKCYYGIQGLDFVPELGKFMVNSHNKTFYLIGPDFDSATIEVGSADFPLQDVAYLDANTLLVNDRRGNRICFAQLSK